MAAKAIVAPQECTSDAGPLCSPSMTSGARYPGVPMNIPVWVILVESGECAMPKSITTGSPSQSMMLPGFRSRCTTPAACTATSPDATPRATFASSAPRSGPRVLTTWSSVWPRTYLVTMYGGSQVTSASMTSATNGLRTRRIVSTSRASRRRASGSPATAGRSTLTATWRCSASAAR